MVPTYVMTKKTSDQVMELL